MGDTVIKLAMGKFVRFGEGWARRGLRGLRLALVAALIAGPAIVFGPGTASACACGAFVSDSRLSATHETAVVRLAGGRETVTLNIATDTDAARAAFLMPVPSRAGFELADPELFVELDEISKPEVRYREVELDSGADGAGAPGGPGGDQVIVTDRVELGPYDVAQLTGTDATAVADWLAANDFELAPELGDALTPYLAGGWYIIAVALTPDAAAETFAGGLPPMRLDFATEAPVYPMRLSAVAEYLQPLRLYVLADHRMDATSPTPGAGEPELTYADWVAPEDLGDYPALAKQVTERTFLTRYDQEVDPADVTEDITFSPAAKDEAYRAVVTETRYVSRPGPIERANEATGGNLAWIGLGVLGVLAVALVLIFGARRSRTPS